MANKKRGRPKNSSSGESFNDIVQEISEATQLPPSMVKSVLKSWTDIFMRNVILDGKFHWHNCFSVSTKTRPEHKMFNVNTQKYEMRPETPILQMKISPRLRGFWRWKIRNQRNAERGVTRDNWKTWYDDDTKGTEN